MPPGLSRAYLLALAPAAFLAPVPLLFTHGASRSAILLYELVLLYLWTRARTGRPVRISDAWLNVLGLAYLGWLAFEMATLRLGLLRSVSHLLLFTAAAKLGSLKRPSEARLALLVVFLLTLAAASSSTNVSSLAYFAAMAWLGFRTLGRIAVLADFSEAPPDRVLASVPTPGISAVAIGAAAACTVPLFFALPRLHGPFAVAPVRLEDAFSQAQTADRVDLESFSAAKRSDRVILRLTARPDPPTGDALRLREADFTRYQDGVWVREPGGGPRRGMRSAFAGRGDPAAVMSIELNAIGRGFLFLPYGTSAVRIERGRANERSDGVMEISGRGPVRYEADVVRAPARGAGRATISVADVPPEVQEYAFTLTGDLTDPREIYRRIERHLLKEFVYTLDPPRAKGDPIAHFLKRSKAGHCEYFASAAAMMLAARGIPARLVTGSYGGEEGLFARTILVRADNLHAWVEADLDGTGFQVLDPTPPAGVPPPLRSFSLLSRLASLGKEIEFFYDRRVLGFDSADQAGAAETVRETLSDAASSLTGLRERAAGYATAQNAGLILVGVGCIWLAWRHRRDTRAARGSTAARAYLTLRRLLAKRRGFVPDSVPPAEVARLFGREAPPGAGDARAVVDIYCASAFGGVEPGPEERRQLRERVRRLKRLA